MTILSPEEFHKRMCQIEEEYEGDTEMLHKHWDIELANLLCTLGYSEGIEVYKKPTLWYA